MSLPKHDPGLAKFITSLDPSMYSISGGEPPTAPIAKEIEGLRNDLESRYRETQIRNDAQIGIESNTELPLRRSKRYLEHLEKNSNRIDRENQFRQSAEYRNSPLHIQDSLNETLQLIGVILFAIILILGFLYTLLR